MREQSAYSYTILRYVHDVVAGEFLNVGVVMHAPNRGVLLVKTQTSIGRLRQAFPEIDLHVFRDMMTSIESGISSLAGQLVQAPPIDSHVDARSHALKVLPDDDSSLQWSPAARGLTADVPKTLERLFARYVTQHEGSASQEGRRRS